MDYIYKAPEGKTIANFEFGDRNNLRVFFTDGTEVLVHTDTVKNRLQCDEEVAFREL